MVDVFISYPRTARSKVEPIKAKLEGLGFDVFFDLENIDGGQNFPDVVDRALRSSRAILCCWSPRYFERPWCMIECRDGLARGNIVPVAVESFDEFAPPADLRQVNYFDLTNWQGSEDDAEWKRVLNSLSKHIGRDPQAVAPAAVAAAVPTPREIVADLRATWKEFPDKNNSSAVQKFFDRVHAVAPGSGLEFELEHHLEQLRPKPAAPSEQPPARDPLAPVGYRFSRFVQFGQAFALAYLAFLALAVVAGTFADITRDIAVPADWIGLPLAALAAAYFLFQLVRRFRRRELVSLSEEGISDTRIRRAAIPWPSIRRVHFKGRTAFSASAVELEIDNPRDYCDPRWYSGLRGWLLPRLVAGRSTLRVYVDRLNAKPGEIYTTTVEWWTAYRGR